MAETNNVSYQYGVEPALQGAGFSENSGDDWVFPEAQTESIQVFDSDGLSHTLVLDANDGLFQDISGRDGPTGGSVSKVHKDKVDTDGTGGTDVAPELTFAEDTAVSEHFPIESLEEHLNTRPYDESLRDTSGYDSRGYPDDFQIDFYQYVNGDPTTWTWRNRDIDIDGDISGDRWVQDKNIHRIQNKIIANKGEHLIVGRQSTYKSSDKENEPAKTTTSEMDYQETLADPLAWIGIKDDTPLNRVNGAATTGDFNSLVTGPDGEGNSAIDFDGTQAMNVSFTGDMSGDFSLQFMISDSTVTGNLIKVGSLCVISLSENAGVYTIQWADGTNTKTQVLTWDGTGWVGLEIVRSGSNLIFREGVGS